MNPQIFALVSSSFFAEAATWINLLAVLDFLQRGGYSTFQQSVVLTVGLAVAMFCAPFSAAAIARFSGKTTLYAATVGRIVFTCMLSIGIGSSSLTMIVVAYVLAGATGALYFPALNSTIPLVAPAQHLLRINALNFNMLTLARILGASGAGFAFATTDTFSVALLALAGHLIALLLLVVAMYSLPSRSPRTEVESAPRRRLFAREHWVRIRGSGLILLTIIPFIFISGFNLFVVAASPRLSIPDIKSWIYAIEGVSLLLAGLLVGKLGKTIALVDLLRVAALLMVFGLVLQAIASTPLLVLASFGIFGFGAGLFIPTLITAIQRSVQPQAVGEYFAAKQAIDNFLMLALMPAYGLLLQTLDYSAVILLVACVSGGLALLLLGRSNGRALESQIRTSQESK